jgi:hypothetical protein
MKPLPKKKDGPDIIDKILEACYQHNKDALFTMSLMHQYEDRGWLTKKQLQGLHNKASRVKDLPVGLLASLEAIILKMPERDKSPITKIVTESTVNPNITIWLQAILAKYPQHKTVLALQLKFEKEKDLSGSDIATLEKLVKALK